MNTALVLIVYMFSGSAVFAQEPGVAIPQKPEMEVQVMTSEEAAKVRLKDAPVKEKPRADVEEEPRPSAEAAATPEIHCPEDDFQNSLLIHHINAGSGDATFIRTPKGLTALVDAGPWAEPNVVALTLKQCYQIEKLDFLILTSNYNREIGGVESVQKIIQIKNRYDIDKFKPPIKKDVMKNADNVRFQFHQNTKSLALTVRWGQFDYYIGGDDVDEKKIARAVGDVDIMRANQHGNETANSEPFTHALRPEQIIISRGDQISEDHEFMKRIARTPSVRHVYQTPTDGNVVVIANKDSYKINGRDSNADATEADNLVTESADMDVAPPKAKLIASPGRHKKRGPASQDLEEDSSAEQALPDLIPDDSDP